jgi:NAD-dependent deacetylase
MSRGQAPDIIALTGGALARESGFAPFDAQSMPAGLQLDDVVTRGGFERDPAAVLEFYNFRRRQLLATKPNPAHEALAVLDTVRRREVLIVTRNIDDFHERAGSHAVIHTHGELLKARCLICTRISERYDDVSGETSCPICGNAGHLRPHVVWVGEEPLRMAAIYEALAHCKLLLLIGLPGGNEPTRGFITDARRAGARTVEFNPDLSPPDLSPNAELFDERYGGAVGETVPAFVKRLIAE